MTISVVIPFPGAQVSRPTPPTPQRSTVDAGTDVSARAPAFAGRVPSGGQDGAGNTTAGGRVDPRPRSLLNSSSQLAAQEIGTKDAASGELTDAEREQVSDLRRIDAEVRRHEQAHARVGGQYAGAPSYQYTTGPDGKRYATSGEVPIDVTPVANDPKATIAKMDQVRRAALAPAEPSPQDRSVAAKASQEKAKAQTELTQQTAEERANPQAAADAAAGGASSDTGASAASTTATPSTPQTVEIGSLFGITA